MVRSDAPRLTAREQRKLRRNSFDSLAGGANSPRLILEIDERLPGMIAGTSGGHCGYLGPCACILFQHHDAHALGTALLMGALFLHGNIGAISGNVSAILGVCGGMRSLG
jgi:hypothetical protein